MTARRPSVLGPALRVGALAVVVTLTAVLAQNPAAGAFTGLTGSAGNSVTSAPAFCPGPGGGTPLVNKDTFISEGSPTGGNGGNKYLNVTSLAGGDTRALVSFPLGPMPAGCRVISATLRLWNGTPVAGRVIDVYQVAPGTPWDEYLATWSSPPTVTGAPAPSTVTGSLPYWQQWDVTAIVRAQYSGTNTGLLVQDSSENNVGSSVLNRYESRENGQRPELVVSWG